MVSVLLTVHRLFTAYTLIKLAQTKQEKSKSIKTEAARLNFRISSIMLKEIKAPTGYSLSTEVFALNANENVNVNEDY